MAGSGRMAQCLILAHLSVAESIHGMVASQMMLEVRRIASRCLAVQDYGMMVIVRVIVGFCAMRTHQLKDQHQSQLQDQLQSH